MNRLKSQRSSNKQKVQVISVQMETGAEDSDMELSNLAEGAQERDDSMMDSLAGSADAERLDEGALEDSEARVLDLEEGAGGREESAVDSLAGCVDGECLDRGLQDSQVRRSDLEEGAGGRDETVFDSSAGSADAGRLDEGLQDSDIPDLEVAVVDSLKGSASERLDERGVQDWQCKDEGAQGREESVVYPAEIAAHARDAKNAALNGSRDFDARDLRPTTSDVLLTMKLGDAVEDDARAVARSLTSLLASLKSALSEVTGSSVEHMHTENEAAGQVQDAAIDAAAKGNRFINGCLRLNEEMKGMKNVAAQLETLKQKVDQFEYQANQYLPRH